MLAGRGWPHEKQTEGCPGVAMVIMPHAGQRTCTTAGAPAASSAGAGAGAKGTGTCGVGGGGAYCAAGGGAAYAAAGAGAAYAAATGAGVTSPIMLYGPCGGAPP